ncbi:MFS transporter [Cyanobacterium sp. IPPAS B-1200]|uniref:MFS transporter n=1 Tax=Cyanobacterium sp. IPPAS B-1200 TaxID=1562720 RepID=UPI003D47BC48
MTNKTPLDRQVWILAGGRTLLQFGTGFTLFYAPLFFVNQLGFSPTSVGVALGSASVSGIIGRFLGGSWSDSPTWGRKKTLLLSALISAFADVFLASTSDYPSLLIGNLLMGLGIGFYWPPAEAMIADLTTSDQRNFAFALNRLGDSVGLGFGVAIGGALIALTGSYRLLFIIDGISFVVFYGVIFWAIKESGEKERIAQSFWQGWRKTLKDYNLWIFCVVNVIFTTYIMQLQSTLPLYLTNFAVNPDDFSITRISGLFSLHIAFAALFQLPIVKILNRLTHIQGLILSFLFWAVGFILIWLAGNLTQYAFLTAILAVLVSAIALATYNPPASGFIVKLAPPSLRGIYFAINSQCWAIGNLIGPPLGGFVLDKGENYAHNFWLFSSASVFIGIMILLFLQYNMQKNKQPYF